MHKAFEPQPTQLTVNQATGVAVNAAAAAGQSEPPLKERSTVTCNQPPKATAANIGKYSIASNHIQAATMHHSQL
jgi:hypothetical protein